MPYPIFVFGPPILRPGSFVISALRLARRLAIDLGTPVAHGVDK